MCALGTFIGKTEKKASTRSFRPFSEKNVFTIVPHTSLLSSIQRKQIIEQIKNTLGAPEEHFEILYQNLIVDFVEFVQILPVNNEARLASLLDEALYRGLSTLQEYKQDNTEEFDPLMAYVLFSTALLFDVGSIIENRTVIICNKQGEFLRNWNPHEGPMQAEDGYYRIRRGGGSTSWSSRRLTVHFAGILMPKDGMAWIYHNSHAYNVWLALLHYDREGAGRFSMYLDRALELLERFKLTGDFFQMLVDQSLIGYTSGMDVAESFMDWLENAIKTGHLTINSSTSHAFLVKEGLLLTTEILKDYGDAVSKDVDLNVLLSQLEKLGVSSGKVEGYAAKGAERKAASSFLFGYKQTAKTAADISAAGIDTQKEFQSTTGATLTGLVINSMEVLGAQIGAVTTLSGYIKKAAKAAFAATPGSDYPEIAKTSEKQTVRQQG